MSKEETILVAMGGNALQDPDSDGTYDEQQRTASATATRVVDLLEANGRLVLTHGNGPQIGSIVRQNLEAADVTPPMPLFANGAQSQGLIGFMLQVALLSELSRRDIDATVVPMVTPVAVDPADPAFDDPTKPIGPFLDEEQAGALGDAMGLQVRYFEGRGYRQVVPSPEPVDVYGADVVERILAAGDIPIVAGGGGVPIVETDDGSFEGVNAVIDKDYASAHLGSQLDVDTFVVLTDVPQVSLNYGTDDQEDCSMLTVETARGYLADGQFPRGSMYEKVEACCRFVESGDWRRAVITNLDDVEAALAGDAGTTIETG